MQISICTAKNFRQIDLQYNSFFSEKVNLTEFLQNIVGGKLANFNTVEGKFL